ncbi:MAG: hypothetical protein IVW57_19220 [Ktedonobacterales bacterium]|nr:hypothetical protein [Ktedonobacterales bacterium]
MSHGDTGYTSHGKGGSHGAPAATSETGRALKRLAAKEHKVARQARKVDSTVYMGEVLASGNPKRIERYFVRKMAYKLFGKLMGKTINRL